MIVRFFSLLILLWALGFALFAVTLPRPAGTGATDAIVVLTGGPGRVHRGLLLLQAGKAKRMLVSGVDRRVKPHELAAEFGVSEQLVDCCVDLGHDSVDTRSNAAETAGWAEKRGFRSIRLVTTDWHMPRAHYELSRTVGPDVAIVTDAVISQPGLIALLKEYNKYLLRRLAAPIGI